MTRRGRTVSSVLAADERLSARLYYSGTGAYRVAWQLLEHSGNGLFWVPLPATIFCMPLTVTLRILLANLFLGFLYDLALIGTVKMVLKRSRPQYNKDFKYVVSVDQYSFPSGHASRTSFIATLCCLRLHTVWEEAPVRPPVSLPLILTLVIVWSLMTASSRIFLGRHFVSDVCMGLILGVLLGYAVAGPLWVSHPAIAACCPALSKFFGVDWSCYSHTGS
eukprot:jgi/Mesvir1/29207/Mv08625-RA.1